MTETADGHDDELVKHYLPLYYVEYYLCIYSLYKSYTEYSKIENEIQYKHTKTHTMNIHQNTLSVPTTLKTTLAIAYSQMYNYTMIYYLLI